MQPHFYDAADAMGIAYSTCAQAGGKKRRTNKKQLAIASNAVADNNAENNDLEPTTSNTLPLQGSSPINPINNLMLNPRKISTGNMTSQWMDVGQLNALLDATPTAPSPATTADAPDTEPPVMREVKAMNFLHGVTSLASYKVDCTRRPAKRAHKADGPNSEQELASSTAQSSSGAVCPAPQKLAPTWLSPFTLQTSWDQLVATLPADTTNKNMARVCSELFNNVDFVFSVPDNLEYMLHIRKIILAVPKQMNFKIGMCRDPNHRFNLSPFAYSKRAVCDHDRSKWTLMVILFMHHVQSTAAMLEHCLNNDPFFWTQNCKNQRREFDTYDRFKHGEEESAESFNHWFVYVVVGTPM